MAKNEFNPIWLILIALAIFGLWKIGAFSGLMASITPLFEVPDDYIAYENFNSGIEPVMTCGAQRWDSTKGYGYDISVDSEKYSFSFWYGGSLPIGVICPSYEFIKETSWFGSSPHLYVDVGQTTIKLKRDFKGNDFKAKIGYDAVAGADGSIRGGFSVSMGGKEIFSKYDVPQSESGLFQIKSSLINPDYIEVFWQGISYGQHDMTGLDGKITIIPYIRGGFYLDDIKYKVHWETCLIGDGEEFAYDSFVGAREVSIFSTRKVIERFCINQPPVIMDAQGGIEQVTELLPIFARGGTYSLPSGYTLLVPYIWKNDGSLPLCLADQIRNSVSNDCENIKAITWFCSGIWDSATHSCTVYGTYQTVYDCVGTIDLSTSPPTCVIHYPEQIVCDDPNAIPDGINKVCYVKGRVVNGVDVCDDLGNSCESLGYTYNPSTERWEKKPLRTVDCPLNSAYNSTIDRCVDIYGISYPIIDAKTDCSNRGGNWSNNKCTIISETVNLCSDGSIPQFIDGQYRCPPKIINQTSQCPTGTTYINGNCIVVAIPKVPIWKSLLGSIGIIGIVIAVIIGAIFTFSMMERKK